VWLAPVQAIVLPITDAQNDYAGQVCKKLEEAGVRAEIDTRSEKVNHKIREAQLQKIPYMLVVGGKEAESGEVSVRHRKRANEGAQSLNAFLAHITRLIETKDTAD
jgi:threonyl-tRNA synthetase